ncbi:MULTISPECIES: allantoicase [Pandoraea]|uniref:allantoicase n=1 Tax=Pandoraea TaxID=93217 RepID=UPI001F5CB5D0|nr:MULTISPECIES: allantoicase [Pandoraea]MCI3206116.1 allantoicase [Pandoraea sp. LA3]MDN4584144.1 allantoicase [Pandoraea capi]
MALAPQDPNAPEFVRRYVNLADPRLGAQALVASDEFFAAKERMLNPEPAVFIPGKYDDNGKWMDGWETRRKRVNGYDWCIVKLARPGVLFGVDLDTSHFTGNFPPAASLEGCYSPDSAPSDAAEWFELLPSTTLQGNSHHYHAITQQRAATHVRVNLYPDGGLARLRLYGLPQSDWANRSRDELIDLIAMENGGYVVAANNQHFGMASNLLMPGRGVNMGDGWETRRRREPGNDWAIIALAQPGEIGKIEVDTAHFKGNFPDRCSIQAAYVTGGTEQSLITQSMFWPVLLPEQKLAMDKQFHFEEQVQKLGAITHIRFNIIPDGGVSRLRLWGRLSDTK